ncbi:MAG: GTP-binding protein [Clostridium sp.]
MKRCLEVVTGFLGSGKSTFINSLIPLTITPKDKILVIQLESGAISINPHSLVNTIKFTDDLENLSNFILESTYKFKPTRVIIEFNGTLPLDELQENLNNKNLTKEFQFGANYFLCDGKTIDSYLVNMGNILIPLISSANIVTVTNTVSIPHKILAPSLKKLKSINTRAFILCVDSSEELYTTLLKSNLFNRKLLTKKLQSISNFFKRDVV